MEEKERIARRIKVKLKGLSGEKKRELIDREYKKIRAEKIKKYQKEALKKQKEEEEIQRKEEYKKMEEAEAKHKAEMKRKLKEEKATKVELKVEYADKIRHLTKEEREVFINKKFEDIQESKQKKDDEIKKIQEKKKNMDYEIKSIINHLDEYPVTVTSSEQELERCIFAYLKGKRPDMKIEFQKKLETGGKIDILINDTIGVELKIADCRNNLRNLIGQIEEYSEVFHKLLVIILDVGYLDEGTIDRYVDNFEKKGATTFVMKGELRRHKRSKGQ
jgi:hypothetical protein